MDDRLDLQKVGTPEVNSEARTRSKDKVRKKMTKELFQTWGRKSKKTTDEINHRRDRSQNITLIQETDTTVEFDWNKPMWSRFEDKVWQMFHSLGKGTDMLLPYGDRDTVLNYDGSNTQQIDGLFVDSDYVWVVECKYRKMEGGKRASSASIRQDMEGWAGKWRRITKKLSTIPECSNKTPVFVLATYGVSIDDKLLKTMESFDGVILEEERINSLTNLSTHFGPKSAMAIFKQELFRGTKFEKIEGLAETFLANKTEIDGFTLYHFFAPTARIVHLCHVRRRMPTGGDLSLAYQRILKPKKVSAIRSYLPSPGAFFPNSIIMASDHQITWSKEISDGKNEIGKITLPNKYGALNVIDGQHRLYGTESSDLGTKKPVSICLIEGLSKPEEASLFTTINQEQTRVSADLMWDLYGELGSISPPPDPDNKSQVDQAIKYLVSNIWKRINESKDHPLRNMIKIPSHHHSDQTFIGFGDPLCKKLEKRRNWDPGYLRPNEAWHNAENFARRRVAAFYKSLIDNLTVQWEKSTRRGSKNWLRSSYAFAAIGDVFNFMVEFYGGVPKHRDNWVSKQYESLITKFTYDLSKAIMDEKLGFDRPKKGTSILKAGSNSVRMEFAKDVILHMKQNNPGYYTELAPSVVEEDESDFPSDKTRERVEEIELRMRGVIYHAYHQHYGEEWWNKVPKIILDKFEDYIETEELYGRDLELGDEEILEGTQISDLWEMLNQKKAPPSLFKIGKDRNSLFGRSKGQFKIRWYDELRRLRNIIAHHRKYPDAETRQRWTGSLKWIEASLDRAEDRLAKKNQDGDESE